MKGVTKIYKAKEKPGIVLYWETFDAFEELEDKEIVTLIFAMRDYARYGVIPNFEKGSVESVLWKLIKQKIDADIEKYKEKQEIGRIGGNSSGKNKTETNGTPPTTDVSKWNIRYGNI